MKKLSLFLVMMLLLCFCSLHVNRLQACDANLTVCRVVNTSTNEIKPTLKKIHIENTNDIDMPLNALMNPFIPM